MKYNIIFICYIVNFIYLPNNVFELSKICVFVKKFHFINIKKIRIFYKLRHCDA